LQIAGDRFRVPDASNIPLKGYFKPAGI